MQLFHFSEYAQQLFCIFNNKEADYIKQLLTKPQADCLTQLLTIYDAETIMYMRYMREQQDATNADIYDIELSTLMSALVNGYEYALTTLDKWRHKYTELTNSLAFFSGMPGYAQEEAEYRKAVTILAELDADFELGIIPKEAL